MLAHALYNNRRTSILSSVQSRMTRPTGVSSSATPPVRISVSAQTLTNSTSSSSLLNCDMHCLYLSISEFSTRYTSGPFFRVQAAIRSAAFQSSSSGTCIVHKAQPREPSLRRRCHSSQLPQRGRRCATVRYPGLITC